MNLRWLFKITKDKKKEDLISIISNYNNNNTNNHVFLVNSHHIFTSFSEINDKFYINIGSEMSEIFEKHSRSYNLVLFRKSFTQFSVNYILI